MPSSPWRLWLDWHPRRGKRSSRRYVFRPCLEALEERWLLRSGAPFVVTNTNDSGQGSLRQAIINSNQNPPSSGTNLIQFDIPGQGVHTINLLSALPGVTAPVVINGYSQPGASPNTLSHGDNAVLDIQIDASALPTPFSNKSGFTPPQTALTLVADNSTVCGLVISGAAQDAIDVEGDGDQIVGNFLGTDPTGTAVGFTPKFNATAGGALVYVGGSDALIGSPSPADRNLISGNQGGMGLGVGIDLDGSGNVVQGNLIGTDVTGAVALGNSHSGVLIEAFSGDGTDNTVGGTTAGAGNVISGNDGAGIFVVFNASNNLIEGNDIGTDATGTLDLGNDGGGVFFSGASFNTVGGTAAGAGNTIAHNTGAGVAVTEETSSPGIPPIQAIDNAILGNAIFANTALGIDLADDGVTQNDSQGHNGPNDFQDFPVLAAVQPSSGTTTVQGTLSGSPDTTFLVQFFANIAPDPSGHGQGEDFLGSTSVTTNDNGQAQFTAVMAVGLPPSAQFLSATATDPGGNTSEFSGDIFVGSAGISIFSGSGSTLPTGGGTTSSPSTAPAAGSTGTISAAAVPGGTAAPAAAPPGSFANPQNEAIAAARLAAAALGPGNGSPPTFETTAGAGPGTVTGLQGMMGNGPAVGGGDDGEADATGFALAVSEFQPTFKAALGLANAGNTLVEPLSDLVSNLEQANPPAGFPIKLAAAEEEGEQSLLLFRVEGKALRVSSSLSEADDSVALVEALARVPVAQILPVVAVKGAADAPPRPVAVAPVTVPAVFPAVAAPVSRAAADEQEEKQPTEASRPILRVWLTTGLAAAAVAGSGGAWYWWGRRRSPCQGGTDDDIPPDDPGLPEGV